LLPWVAAHRLELVLLVLLPAAGAVGVAQIPRLDPDVKRVLYAAAATLVFGGLLGGLLKLLLDDAALARQQREADATYVRNLLNDLKAVYDRVARTRILIPAHQSAKTYGEEMRDLIDSRVQLKNVQRALEGRTEGMTKDTREKVQTTVKAMEKYLDELIVEFQREYKRLSDGQRAHEEYVAASLKAWARDGSGAPPTFATRVWDELKNLEGVRGFIGEEKGSAYETNFLIPLDAASNILRDELARIVEG
jgi:hypothetical protein